jgi:hypothetical protein
MTAGYDQYAELLTKFTKPGYTPHIIRKDEKKKQ